MEAKSKTADLQKAATLRFGRNKRKENSQIVIQTSSYAHLPACLKRILQQQLSARRTIKNFSSSYSNYSSDDYGLDSVQIRSEKGLIPGLSQAC